MTLAPGDVVAERHTLGSPHALTILSAHLEGDPRKRFLAEGWIQASLSHRNLVHVTDLVEVGPLLALDRVDGDAFPGATTCGEAPRGADAPPRPLPGGGRSGSWARWARRSSRRSSGGA